MRIVVSVEQVHDPRTVKISRSREELDLRESVMITNPVDKYALEAALRLRETLGGEVIAVSVGGPDVDDTVREAVAMGADRAVLVETEHSVSGGGLVALLVATVQRVGDVDLVLAAETDPRSGGSGVGPRLAAALGWQLVMDAVRLEETNGGLSAHVHSGDSGVEVSVTTPAVVVVAPGSDRPRYPHPSRIANAWNKGLVETWKESELGVSPDALTAEAELGNLVLGPERERGQLLNGSPAEAAATLVELLRGRRLI